MNAIKIYSLKKKLTDVQKQFLKTKTLEDTKKIKDWYKFIKTMSEFDKVTDKAVKELTTIKVILIILNFIAFFVPVIFIGSLPLLIIVWIWRRNVKRIDINNFLRETILPMVYFFNLETNENNKIEIKINLENPLDKKYFVNKVKRKVRPPYLSRTDNHYEKPVFHCDITLDDGSVVKTEVNLNFVKIDVKKISISGKVKFKTKYKAVYETEVKLLVPKDLYLPTENAVYQEVDNFYVTKKKQKVKYKITSKEPPSLEPDEIIEVILKSFKNFQQKQSA